jgi:glycosyltransferase involved in cell wall biosynthesis
MTRSRRTRAPRGRVLLVCGALQPEHDGVADAVLRLAEALRAQGAVVRILHTGPASGVRGARTVGAGWTLGALLTARRYARGADVVHVQFAPSMYRFRIGVGLLPAALPRRLPLVVTLHEYGWWSFAPAVPQPVWQRLERARRLDRETALLVPRAAAAVVTNPAHEHALRQRFGGGVRERRIPIGANVAVAGGIDRDDARRTVRARFGLAPDAVLIAFFGFVHPVKGVRYLADAVARLGEEGRDLHLLVVGGFTSMALPEDEARAFEAELRGWIEAVGATPRTRITGFLPAEEVSRLLLAADLAALPFTAGVTTKSGSLLSVLAHGLPTVVTGGEEPEEALAAVALVVPEVRDARALEAGLRTLLDDRQRATALAEAGAAFAAERDWARIAEQHLDLYRAVAP